MKLLKIVLTIASVFYPFTIVFAPFFTPYIIAFLAILWGVKFYQSKERFDVLLALFFVVAFFAQGFKFLYPVLVNLGLLFVFWHSLKTTPMITRFALMRENLDEYGLRYTKNLTIVWMWFFLFNALISFILSLFEDKNAWAIYCGLISYVLIGALFLTEMIYRRFALNART